MLLVKRGVKHHHGGIERLNIPSRKQETGSGSRINGWWSGSSLFHDSKEPLAGAEFTRMALSNKVVATGIKVPDTLAVVAFTALLSGDACVTVMYAM